MYNVSMVVKRVELVTVTPSSAWIFWRSDSEGEFGVECSSTRGEGDVRAFVHTFDRLRHLALADGLEPCGRYRFRIVSPGGGRSFHSGWFRTPALPPGDFLFRFATFNDLHVGEAVSGQITLPGLPFFSFTPGFRWSGSETPFWRFTTEKVVEEINGVEGVEFVIVKGDLTAEMKPEQMSAAREMLDRLTPPYHVMRGNHDRLGADGADHLLETFRLERSWRSFEHRRHAFILLDTVMPRTGFGVFPRPQLRWLEKELRRFRRIPVFIFCHHPVMRALERFMPGRRRFLSLAASHPRVAGVFNAHSHRNKKVVMRAGGRRVPFVETAAAVEYPGGYNLYEVYAGGYVQTFHRPHDLQCSRWYEITEGEFFGLATRLQFGGMRDRNFTWVYNDGAS
ncbi:MAG: metallophosphoesterase [bacterium]